MRQLYEPSLLLAAGLLDRSHPALASALVT